MSKDFRGNVHHDVAVVLIEAKMVYTRGVCIIDITSSLFSLRRRLYAADNKSNRMRHEANL